MGFGEEHLASGDTLHQSNTLFNNYLLTGERAWYRRSFTIPDFFPAGQRVILHIGASSNVTYVWLDGRYLGMRVDEYSDLVFDLGLLESGSRHTLAVKVQYPHDINSHNMGKQIFWFASAPGIWQSVWLEPRGDQYLTRLHLRPELEFDGDVCLRASVLVSAAACGPVKGTVALTLTAPESGKKYAADIPLIDGEGEARIKIDSPELWQYREGRLYAAEATLTANGASCDTVRSYVGLRKAETRWMPGHSPDETSDLRNQYQYLYLNGKPFYIIGVLDQCYNAFGVYTYRSLKPEGEQGKRGSIAYDVERTLAYGYNLSRVHIKENEPLWYHECDVSGLLVWTEHPGNFYATPEDPNWRSAYNRELDGMLLRLHNHPSIVVASSINESWGVCGAHVTTPWENELRSRFLEDSATRLKSGWPHVIVCDNSGFGKTAACELNDFHLYPGEHWKARARWEELVRDCYPGSTYNYIHHTHSDHAIGDAVQTGRPIVVSEFLHINGIDMQLRLFEKVAGYLRMNVASHETEDSAPLTAERFERDYGYVDHRMNPIGYDMVNNMDMVVFDHNRITRVEAGGEIVANLSTAHFSWRKTKQPVLSVTVTGIDRLGRYTEDMQSWRVPIAFSAFTVERQAPVTVAIPADMRGAYVFAYVSDGDEVLCRNYIQLLISGVGNPREHAAIIPPGAFVRADGDYVWVYEENGVCAATIHGKGELFYEFNLVKAVGDGALALEVGAREGKNAIKVTDERLYGTQIEVLLDGRTLGLLAPKDDASDERALFSNACQGGDPFHYRKTGKLGYGERFELKTGRLEAGRHTLVFQSGPGGMAIYGAYTGRYGFSPTIVERDVLFKI
jgi:hypothetical protein